MSSPSSLNPIEAYSHFLSPEESAYFQFHQARFTYLGEEVHRLATAKNHPAQPVSLLDIGPHFQTPIFRELLGAAATINTLGWEIGESIVPKGVVDQHFTFDLNDSPYPERWVPMPQHDIIVMAEVFEHLHTAPEYFLGFIRTLLKPDGYLLIGTPNAVSLTHRVHMVGGNNPFEKIRVTINNPGHFREYTVQELKTYAKMSGFSVERTTLSDFYPSSPMARLLKSYVPTLRDCIHIVFRKNAEPDRPVPLTLW
ncbi:methyltransferase domain-containing protein [Spirosoma koreense]